MSYSPLWPVGHSGSLPRLLAHPCCSGSRCLTHGLCPCFLRPPLTGGSTCMHWEWAAGPAIGATAPSATRFVPPKLPLLGLGLRPAFLCGAPPTPAELNPSSWGLARAAQGRGGRGLGAGQAQSKARPGLAGTQPPEPCTHGPHSVSLETGNALLRK